MTEFHVFLSYTSREEEVKQVKPLISIYCRDLWEWAQSNGIKIFYDEFTIEKKQYSDQELKTILRSAINRSHLMTAFLSPGYVESKWCRFEYLETRINGRPILHGIVWKWFSLNILPFSAEAEYLTPEGQTDVTYLRENPTLEEFKQAARECVKDSIQLIRSCYQI